jgi:hypothetical protein
VLLLVTREAHAVDPFEIQVYDGTANQRGAPGVELHVNHVASGLKTAEPPELPQHGQSRFTLEPSFGVAPWWELGAYLQSALRRDGTFDYAGAKLRSKFVTPPGWHPHLRLGVNVEVSRLPERYEADRWATELRPIFAWEARSWLVALNPILDQSLAGAGAADGPSLEPAAMALYKIEELVSVGLEYYANFGPIAHGFVPARREEQYLYEVVNLLAVPRFELNAGVGEGFTDASNGFVFKIILGYVFERSTADPMPRRADRGGSGPPSGSFSAP